MKILIAEDDVISCRDLEKHLREWGYDVVAARDGNQAWELAKTNNIRLAILDWNMPGIDGIELSQRIRKEYQKEDSKYIYIILLTGRGGQDDIIQGLSTGADDYITKPYSFIELKYRIQNGERIINNEDRRIRLASLDNLTRLWNRNKIFEFLENELKRGEREGHPTGVIMIDIDHFKRINDRFGHLIGDRVLVEVADRLSTTIRPYDKIGRYGGDEILIVLPKCGSREAKTIAERLYHSVTSEKISTDAGVLKVNISVGCVSNEKFPQSSKMQLIQASDKALLSAKKKGRDRIILARSV
ncbi:MAG: diguanylate cyclase [Candidatus Aminicenantes bacterium]|jgi:two-component system cell cycle response regulator|nr:diguanylate cyclase [Candidatus Aminicenantes bacterium]MDH5383731.1 diguanylate cyclase [Candidatus Aminicenantes bacterium]MDH5743994.1 diguanylate cyclase [Candidatus Aminicenantes bacterium]